ncbi:carboxypeptidase-like regulatory domain-containing protein [Winogradskyella sp.]|jgi:hypothetical protein|uniref:carboxypeptidase-like regulatory domain-containing protein n=1 Tax=Winogradskyella sp. TaxID=1883156 RepID=UPI0025F51192|nr:carboxypeptidase-like regulatory domain-containing protein [Winogradskyella sp.]MCT4630959.1 hypothetical protein [Winogradskyella sp.]
MNNKFVFYFIVIFFFSCANTEVDNDIRVLVKGFVVDQDNMPLQDAKISIYADANSLGASEVLLGEGISDNEGAFKITSLFGSNNLFYVTVELDNHYSKYRFQTSTEEYIPDDLVFDLGTVELVQLTNFNYTIIRESGENTILNYSFRFIEPSCTEVFNETILDVENSQCYEVRQISRQLNNIYPNIEDSQLIVPLQSQVEFIYSINNAEFISQIIDVNILEYEFEFNY